MTEGREIRLRLLEMLMQRGYSDDPATVIETVLQLEQFILAASPAPQQPYPPVNYNGQGGTSAVPSS